jgi:hypothetical protein
VTLTNSEVRRELIKNGYTEKDEVTFSKGIWTVRQGYFYHHGRTERDLINELNNVFRDNIEVLSAGDHWDTFKGSKSVTYTSHFWIKFRIIQSDNVSI